MDRKILALRLKKRPLQEIADRLGFKTHSAVLKRIRKIGKAFECYLGADPAFRKRRLWEMGHNAKVTIKCSLSWIASNIALFKVKCI